MWSLRCGLRQSLGRVMTRAMSASVPQIAPAPIMSANHVKRLNRKKLASALDPAAKTWFVDAYCTAEAYDLNGLHRLIRREGLYDSFEMFEGGFRDAASVNYEHGCDALRITPRYLVDDERREIFFLCGGSVVFWNVTELERLTILRKLRDFEKGRYPENFVFDEAEKMSYSHSEVAKAFLQKNQIILANESSPKHLDKYTFSHALALSVKLGILEATLDEFVEKIEHVHEDLRKEGLIRLSRTEVLKKLGALFALRHSVNLSSEFLDETPDFYWDRENLEPLYQHMKDYLNIGKRAKVMNEKLSLCCDLMDILVTHLNDTHHVRLEWMIIILIVIEVVCEFIHLMPLNMNDDFDSDTGDDDLFSDDINHDVPFHHAGTLMELNDNKAGMADLDKEKISRIIEEASKGSKFYDHKKKQQERIDAKIADLLRKKKAITEEQLKNASAKVGQIVRNLEKSRDLSRTFVHVDMDAFYAAVEMRDDPSLSDGSENIIVFIRRDKPMAVGGPGMLATSNYLARRFGVRAAMPGFIGQKLCPDLIIVPPNFEKYRAVNAIFSEVFAKYDPNYSAMSLDEAYLDITEFLRLDQNVRKPSDLSHAEEVVSDLREEIFLATQLTASAGIAPNTLLAKVCSDINKPNGQFYLRPERPVVAEFVEKLSVRKACGIGKVLESKLH
ncbi:unnamed protein product [Notodromas monacha]|uniref:DNA polymerase kappa n=1 Tax=Notodromas monacha TaxID=399045 RepID=A0A7R9BEU0_9CRUS|nr:unnamed protein product [Notodromas monacha]CAG0914050.1 unnamed protein product [Notodromas monacha]